MYLNCGGTHAKVASFMMFVLFSCIVYVVPIVSFSTFSGSPSTITHEP